MEGGGWLWCGLLSASCFSVPQWFMRATCGGLREETDKRALETRLRVKTIARAVKARGTRPGKMKPPN